RFTMASGVASQLTTTIVLIVEHRGLGAVANRVAEPSVAGCVPAIGPLPIMVGSSAIVDDATPAAITSVSPTVTTAMAITPAIDAVTTSAFCVRAAVMRPTHGAGSDRALANDEISLSRSCHAKSFVTCRFTSVLAVTKPPPTAAVDTTGSGEADVSTTASASMSTVIPSMHSMRQALVWTARTVHPAARLM